MYSRWFDVAVVMLWVSAMSWLVTQKVLPPLLVGQPPSYRTILEARKSEPPVGWKMIFNGRQLGWALSNTSRLPDGLTEIRSRVHFDELPLEDIAPGWLRAPLRLIKHPQTQLQMDAESTLSIDSLGRLLRFDSAVRLDPLGTVVKLKGIVDGTKLRLSISSGDFSHRTELYLPMDALLDDALTPQTQLPGLRTGQTWTVPTYSPFRPQNNPLEILQATVEGTEPIFWNGCPQHTWLVVYRSDPGFGLGSDNTPRGRLWVRRDGTVLKQQVMIYGSTMVFVRLPDDEVAALEGTVGSRR